MNKINEYKMTMTKSEFNDYIPTRDTRYSKLRNDLEDLFFKNPDTAFHILEILSRLGYEKKMIKSKSLAKNGFTRWSGYGSVKPILTKFINEGYIVQKGVYYMNK